MQVIFKIIFLSFIGFFVINGKTQAQNADTIKSETPKKKYKNPRPRNAALMSMVLPGLGQAYNKKYWKTPIVLAGLIIDGIIYQKNRNGFLLYKHALGVRTDTIKNNDKDFKGYTPLFDNIPNDVLKVEKDSYERYYTLNLIIGSAIFALNIMDAYVDAHLKEFDVKEDLAIKIKPSIRMGYNNTVTTGISVTFKFK